MGGGSFSINKLVNSKMTIFIFILVLVMAGFLIHWLVIRPYLSQVYAYRGLENLREENHQSALSNFQYAIQLHPQNGKTLFNLGSTYYNLGEYEKAAHILNQSKKYYNDLDIYMNLGLSYLQLHHYQKAKIEFDQAIYLNPKFYDAHYYLGLSYFLDKNDKKAINQWEALLQCEPEYQYQYLIYYHIGLIYQNNEMPDEAFDYFLKALHLAPEDSPVVPNINAELEKMNQNNDKQIMDLFKYK
jgi:tetratricopeptide (TPR) repeat protein